MEAVWQFAREEEVHRLLICLSGDFEQTVSFILFQASQLQLQRRMSPSRYHLSSDLELSLLLIVLIMGNVTLAHLNRLAEIG